MIDVYIVGYTGGTVGGHEKVFIGEDAKRDAERWYNQWVNDMNTQVGRRQISTYTSSVYIKHGTVEDLAIIKKQSNI
jgi:hypothetical protein